MMFSIFTIQFVLLLTVEIYASPVKYKSEWLATGQKEVKESLHQEINENIAKNVILFLGDGMGISTITAARIYKGQQQGKEENAEAYNLSFDEFPHLALIKTYCEDRITPDSAATATAYLSGVKVNKGVIGLDAHVEYGKCTKNVETSKVPSILKWSQKQGKSVGVVTTTRVTHATPAGTYAHTPKRDWECDADIPNGTLSVCKDIASQLVEDNPDIQVILGGGRKKFLPKETVDPEYPTKYGEREDGKDLTKIWLEKQKKLKRSADYIWNMDQFKKIDPKKTDYLFGLFENTHLQFEMDREKNKNKDPTLAELTVKAIEILRKNDKGFFLLVEGGRIDHGHHEGRAKAALSETASFDDAIRAASKIVDIKDTLIVVTADHSHVFNLAGYPPRGTDLLGLVPTGPDDKLPNDNMPMTVLLYGNGPGYTHPRQNLTNVDTTKDTYVQQSAVSLKKETHGGEDVSVHAIGPMSHLFKGVKEQNFIALAMGYASCVYGDTSHCKTSAAPPSRFVPTVFIFSLLQLIINHILR